MDRQQYKYTFNKIKSNTILPETRGSKLVRAKHPSTDETGENDLTNTKMIEAFKEGMRNSFKEIDEKTQKMEEMKKKQKK